ncbi:unnamed protein product [Ilex paraguariensis]|uniref:PLAC8 motif-containing protein n=1 Tax=Ilex paraguariensis TaxID=185542 RepID=A0ABC8SGQ5_9AQUA
MVSTGNGESSVEIQEESPLSETPSDYKSNGQVSLYLSASQMGLLSDSDPKSGFQGVKPAVPSRLRIFQFSSDGGLASPSAKFRRLAEERDEMSQSVPPSSGQGIRGRFNRVFTQRIEWASVWEISKEWIRDPLNMALLLWVISVAVSGAILFLVMTGMLNAVLPKKSQRNAWFEVNNQILNALFTLMCLYQHPKRFHHLVLLCRWKPKDISQLRKIYCKNGTYKPHEWTHMVVVIVLLHVNCLGQYALCGLNLGYRRSERPAVGVGICLSVAFAAPAVAGLYGILSPLGREYDLELDEETQFHIPTAGSQPNYPRVKSLERRFSFSPRNEQRIIENRPEWRGGLFDFWENITLAYLSLFCILCVFGWNMERLGFGNMYVHIATFLLFCMAPFWIFNLAAINIDNETVREALGVTGVVLCLFGLLYGGFWRIQMRKRFDLPENNSCFGKPAVADCAQWLFCCWCSLAQEVRTADFYDIVEDKFCRKQTYLGGDAHHSPLPRENGLAQYRSCPCSPLGNSQRMSKLRPNDCYHLSRFSEYSYNSDEQLAKVEAFASIGLDSSMKPPVPSIVQR